MSARVIRVPLEKAETGTIVCVKNTSEEAAEIKRCYVPEPGGGEGGERETVALPCRGSRWAGNSISEQDGSRGWWSKVGALGRLSWRPGSVAGQALTFIEFLLCAKCCVCAKSLQSRPTLYDPMDCSLPGPSVGGIPQARILEWAAIPFSRTPSRPKDRTRVSHVSRWWAGSSPLAPLGKPTQYCTRYLLRYLFSMILNENEGVVWSWSYHRPSLNLSLFFWKVKVTIHNPKKNLLVH